MFTVGTAASHWKPPGFLENVRTLVSVYVEEGSGAPQSSQQILSSVVRDRGEEQRVVTHPWVS